MAPAQQAEFLLSKVVHAAPMLIALLQMLMGLSGKLEHANAVSMEVSYLSVLFSS